MTKKFYVDCFTICEKESRNNTTSIYIWYLAHSDDVLPLSCDKGDRDDHATFYLTLQIPHIFVNSQ